MKLNYKYISVLLPSVMFLASCNLSQLSEKPDLSANAISDTPVAMEKMEKNDGVMEKTEEDISQPIQVSENNSTRPTIPTGEQLDEVEAAEIPEPQEPGSESIQVIDVESLRALNPEPGDDCNQYQGLLRDGCHRAKGTSENPRPSVEDEEE